MSENESKLLICRFCLILIDKNYIYINNYVTIQSMIRFFLPETNIKITSEPIICEICNNILKLSNDFKTNCLENEEKIRDFILKTNSERIDLKNLLKQTIINEIICRLCFQSINNQKLTKLTSEDEILIRGMVQTTIPEIDLELTVDPIACDNCIIQLQSCYNFKNMCLQTEEKIYSFCEKLSMKSDQLINLIDLISDNDEEKLELFDENDKKIDTNDNKLVDFKLAPSCEKISELPTTEIKSEPSLVENDNKSINCPTCQFQAEYKGDLYKHMIKHTKPNNDNMFKCILCDYLSKRKSHVVAHISIHIKPEDMKMFKCTECTFQSKRKVNVTQHMLIHKPINTINLFQCTYCSYKAKWKSSLKQHLQTHNLTKNIKMFKCTECTFETKWNSNLKSHLLLHNDPMKLNQFKCPDCPFQAKYLTTFNKHMNNEHDKDGIVRMFKCTECEHQTKRKSNLKAHLILHLKKRKVADNQN